MKYVQAQFSLKYEPQIRIRRKSNEIEDGLLGLYGPPQTIPIPDDFAAEAPRIILNSNNGHSQLSFSQVSVDLLVNFDNEYVNDFNLTKEYISKRLSVLKDLLLLIGINEFLYLGITYNTRIQINTSCVDYMKSILGNDIGEDKEIYEASRRIASVKEDTFFVNEQIGMAKEYQGQGSVIPSLLNFANSKLISEGINLTIDVNNRYSYLKRSEAVSIDMYESTVEKVYSLVESNLKKWS